MSGVKWYYRPAVILLAILVMGPFAIPLVWLTPAFKKWQKILIIVLLVLFTIWLVRVSVYFYQTLIVELQKMEVILK